MESNRKELEEDQPKKPPTRDLFIPIETKDLPSEDQETFIERRQYFQTIKEKVEVSKEREIELFTAIVRELMNAWFDGENAQSPDHLTLLDDLEGFLEWYCQPLQTRMNAESIVAYPFTDSVCMTAVLVLGKLGFVARQLSLPENAHKSLQRVMALEEFILRDENQLFSSILQD